jgi:hypothetical protein
VRGEVSVGAPERAPGKLVPWLDKERVVGKIGAFGIIELSKVIKNWC